PVPPDAHATYYPDPPTGTDLSGGLPLNLDSLRDSPPGSKPFYPYSTLIRYAIKGSPDQKLLLEDIYYAIESRFPYFRTASSGWKNSVRHNLSLNPCFEKVPRPLTDRGKGSYWTVNDNIDPRTGVHRIRNKTGRRRGRRKANAPPPEEEEEEDFLADQMATPSFVPPPLNMNQAGPSDGPPPPPVGFPPPPFAFDQPFMIPPPPGMRFAFPPPLPPMPDELPMDANGNVDWRAAWRRELQHLQDFTEDADKNDADAEWYRAILFKIRTAMMMPPPPPP
ncbi:hypothetical protein K488DRAFT_13548, partial [Vararia minispora EC-137]